tara:strand:+ start:4304 stop:4714 length:411 start_codon:yes stop_codon:yes gene_type:complete
MNIRSVINAAKEAIEATGMEVKTSSRSDTEMLLGVRRSYRHRVFGPATPIVCWTEAFEYATGKSWVTLLTQWRKTLPIKPRKQQPVSRGELILLAGTATEIEHQLAKLEQEKRLLSAIYAPRRSNQVVTIAHAEVI